MTEVKPFSVSRVFDAPRELVFQAFTDVGHLARWMGPKGYKVIRAALDLRVGGSYHYGLEGPGGARMWGKQVFREILRPERLVYLQSFSDEAGGLARHPMSASWPLLMLSTATFDDAGGGKTRLTISWHPYEADEAGLAAFDGARSSMQGGFAGMFETLDAHLAATACQLVNARVLDAPRERVWAALTDPAQVNAWWGPDGFQNVDVQQDVRVGGTWRFTMVGPDGKRWPNHSTYLEVTPPARLVYDHGDGSAVLFRATIELTELGPRTLLSLTLEAPSREARDGFLKFGAVEGGRQTLGKLAAFLAAGAP